MRIVEKPWGHEIIWAETKHYVGKILVIRKGEKLSLQYHNFKEESIFVEQGLIELQLEDNKNELAVYYLSSGDTKYIAPTQKHRMIAIEDSRVFEVSTPQLDDVVRLSDIYGRL